MYEAFYGLEKKPFQVIPDPSYLYWSEAHLMAFTMLHYGILSGSPLTVISGDVGAGKTTLLCQLLEEFPTDLEAGLVSNIQAGKGDLLEWALMAFDQPYDGGHVQRFQRFQNFLIERYAAGKQVALIIDEAQNLGIEQLEELRMLSNINADQDQILRIILVGQPELREMLARPELRQFAQRITADYHIPPLQLQEVQGYITRRLSLAGATRQIFPAQVCELIYHATGGVPRLINVLADLCLVNGYAADQDIIDEDLLRDLLSSMERNGIFNQFKPLKVAPRLVPAPPSQGAQPVSDAALHRQAPRSQPHVQAPQPFRNDPEAPEPLPPYPGWIQSR
ncbi:MAG: AAA family ATPase [Pseudomonadota bacterium]